MVDLCVPVLTRYDMLKELIFSAEKGIVAPDRYIICDNGGKFNLNDYPKAIQVKLYIYTPRYNIGVAGSWNYLIRNSSDGRIISNDDIIVYSDTIKAMINTKGDFIYASQGKEDNSFSFFIIRDSCINSVGFFDEGISPYYGYFEDNDYSYRMSLLGIEKIRCTCNILHYGSSTIKSFSKEEMDMHHKKFIIARNNYIRKWGGAPGNEIYKTPFNR